jgi:GH15 family glucan-1,4-alpha-glucosidase
MPRAAAFPPIGDYAFLSDREVLALIAPDGALEWLCLPRPDGPSVFGAILDRRAGSFRVGPSGTGTPAGRRYVPGTNVLETTWETPDGWMVVRDALTVGAAKGLPPDAPREVIEGHPAGRVLLRTVTCLRGEVRVAMRCTPGFAYGRRQASWERYGQVLFARGEEQDPVLRLASDQPMRIRGGSASASVDLREGERAYFGLAWRDGELPGRIDEAVDAVWRTADSWRSWLGRGTFPDHPWRAYLQRSALVLKGLQYARNGALLAAATTSLPETPGGERNWDYRYCWIRDATFMLAGLSALGFDLEARAFLSFIRARLDDGPLQVVYGVEGERILPEETLDHLSGYEGSRPVRIGNDAWAQTQHDAWGALVGSVWQASEDGIELDADLWPTLRRQVEAAIDAWPRPDRGMWEVRGEPRRFTSSALMCWVAVDRGAALAERFGKRKVADSWRRAADEIRSSVLERAVDDRGVLVQHDETRALDASVLLAVLTGFLSAEDPRARATVLAVADELTIDGLVLRYRTDETDDGLHGEEGTFAICSFWLVSALVAIGELEQGRALLERLLALASPLGLYAEEQDPATGRHLGNFPQAFTHLALIDAVVRVLAAEEEGGS